MADHPVDRAVRAVLEGTGRIGVACSGGADSIALAAAALRAGPATIVTIDHGLHADSARIAGAVAAWVRGQGAEAIVERVTVEPRASVEAAARDARYAAFERIADAHDLAIVLLGHTARDQAETVLMRVLRGTGPAGLAGIPARRGRFVRPLLALDRSLIDDYVAAHALPTWHDPMNDDLALTRVRVRKAILPDLARENPQLPAALVRLAAATTEWLAVIDERARPFAELPIDCAALAAEPPAIRKRALALAFAALWLDAVHLDALDALVTEPTRGTRTLALPGAAIARVYDRLDYETTASPPAITAPPGYELRAWQPGDRMRVPRLAGHSRKLSDLYGDGKVPRALRDAARVLVRVADGTIVWAEYLGIAHALELGDHERELLAFHVLAPT